MNISPDSIINLWLGGDEMFPFYLTRRRRRVLCCTAIMAMALAGALPAGQMLGQVRAALAPSPPLRLEDADQNTSRVAFLEGLGWQVEEEAAEAEEIVIPLEFDEVYQNYNLLQQEQGFDLSRYCGRTMMRYAYRIGNHPSGEQDVRANLLVYKNRLVGGDVCSLRLDGFMHGLLPPG